MKRSCLWIGVLMLLIASGCGTVTDVQLECQATQMESFVCDDA